MPATKGAEPVRRKQQNSLVSRGSGRFPQLFVSFPQGQYDSASRCDAPSSTMRLGQPLNGPGASMARRRFQTGTIFVRGKNPPKWIGRWREDVVGLDGTVHRVRHSVVLGTTAELPTKRLAGRRLELILARINAPGYR